jgi:hypothetical protein
MEAYDAILPVDALCGQDLGVKAGVDDYCIGVAGHRNLAAPVSRRPRFFSEHASRPR